MKNVEETFKQAIIANLAGIAEYHSEKEIQWKGNSQMKRTIEFPTGSSDLGVIRFYRKNNSLFSEAKYVDKKIAAYWVYHNNGSLKRITLFNNGKRCSLNEYYSSGNRESDKTYYRGNLHGDIKFFKSDGKLHKIMHYSHSILRKGTFFHDTGYITHVSLYRQNSHGYRNCTQTTYFNEAGKISKANSSLRLGKYK